MLALLAPSFVSAAGIRVPEPVLPPVPAIGSQFQAVPAPLPSVTLVGSQDGPFIGVTLDNAIGMALSQNTDLAISESNHRIGRYQVVSDRGPFDVNFVLEPSFNDAKTPAISPFQAGPGGGPTTTLTTGLNTGFNVTTETGTKLGVSAMAQRVYSDSTANSYNPYYTTALSFNLTQSLGSGRYTKDRRDLQLAISNTHAQAAQTLIAASTTITSVIDAYWDLVAAWRSLGIQEQALAQARAQTASNNRLVRRGSAAPVDVVESNTQVDVDQDNVFAAVQNVSTLENQLKGLLLANPADPLWQANIVPISPVAVVPPEPNLRALVVAGLISRPEFAQIAAARRNAEIQAEFARDEGRPKVDLQVGYTMAGFAGENGNLAQNPIFTGFTPLFTDVNSLIAQANAGLPAGATAIPPLATLNFANPQATVGRLGTSWDSLLKNTYPTYTAQVSLSLPIKNDRANGDKAIALETMRQVEIQEAQTIERLIIDARNAIQAFDAARQRLVSAHAARVAADRVLLGETRRFLVGRSTTFLVLQRQIEAANDQGRELQAQTALNKSIAEIDRVSGAVFAKHGIRMAAPPAKTLEQRLQQAGLSTTP